MAFAAPGCWLIALIKPQFEVGRDHVGKGGIVKDETARAAAVAAIENMIANTPGWRVEGIIPSPIEGGSGNIEYLIGARRDG
jgi:23S rRNA (cytidine1920-2'-O)/16S rRNA (cytidine1409-2'-O)-methyltransferase